MKSIAEYLEKLEQLKLDEILYNNCYKFGGYVIQIQANDFRIIKALDEYYEENVIEVPVSIHAIVRAYNDDPEPIEFILKTRELEPGEKEMTEMYGVENGAILVHKIDTMMNFFFKGVERIAHGPLLKNMHQLNAFIQSIKMEQLLQIADGRIFTSSGICKNFVGMGITGGAGVGKSTLCCLLMGAGLDFISDDHLIVDDQDGYLMMSGLPERLKLHQGAFSSTANVKQLLPNKLLAHYESLSLEDLMTTDQKHEVSLKQCYETCEQKLDAQMKFLVFLNWDVNSTQETKLTEVKISERKELLSQIIKAPGLMLPKSKARLEPISEEPYVKLLEKCTLLEMSGKVDFDFAKRELLQLF